MQRKALDKSASAAPSKLVIRHVRIIQDGQKNERSVLLSSSKQIATIGNNGVLSCFPVKGVLLRLRQQLLSMMLSFLCSSVCCRPQRLFRDGSPVKPSFLDARILRVARLELASIAGGALLRSHHSFHGQLLDCLAHPSFPLLPTSTHTVRGLLISVQDFRNLGSVRAPVCSKAVVSPHALYIFRDLTASRRA